MVLVTRQSLYIIPLRLKLMKDTDTLLHIHAPPLSPLLPHIISLGSALLYLMIKVSTVRAWQEQICIRLRTEEFSN